ncbi:hypothetical protein [Aureimonas sp. SK2]|uniref:hypothetical protein n=1 Tax=Aureimonas sp. SK2 TaxID=3015992 RepID=UPI0024446EA1|nr:hypothetical protein [Aureimonas sp. SK2]
MATEVVTQPAPEAILASVRHDRRSPGGLFLPHFQNNGRIELERIAASFLLIDGLLASTVTAAEVETQIAARFAALIGSAPAALDTVQELAAAFNDNPDVIDQILAALGLRATKAELEAAVSSLNTALGGKASTAALGAVTDRVTAIETAFPSRARLIARAIAYSGVR